MQQLQKSHQKIQQYDEIENPDFQFDENWLILKKFTWKTPDFNVAESIINRFDGALNDENILFAGGSWLSKAHTDDIDLFTYIDDDSNEAWINKDVVRVIKKIATVFLITNITCWDGGVSLYGKFNTDPNIIKSRKIQIILYRANTITEILQRFDLSLSQIGYSFKIREMFASELARFSLYTGIMPILRENANTKFASRIYKYVHQKSATIALHKSDYARMSNEYIRCSMPDTNFIVRHNETTILEWFRSNLFKESQFTYGQHKKYAKNAEILECLQKNDSNLFKWMK